MKNFSGIMKFAMGTMSAVLAAVTLTATVSAAKFTDIDNHWSKEFVEYGVEKGYINGYPDGSFLPDKAVTRAEFSKMVNSALGITKTAEITFFDIEESDWYYNDIRKAAYAGYVAGYENGAFLAQNLITRQEAAAILSRISTRPEKVKTISDFKDCEDIAAWAEDYIEYAYSKGYLTGDESGRILPTSSLTRSQAAKILYTLLTTENVYSGNYTVKPEGAICSETIFTDNVLFSPKTEGAFLTLDGCRVLGSVIIDGAKNCSAGIYESEVASLEIEGAHTDVVLDEATVKTVTLEATASISGDKCGTVYLEGDGLLSGVSEIKCDVDSVVVSAGAILKTGKLPALVVDKKASLIVQSGEIESMKVLSGAAKSVITLADSVTVNKLDVSAVVSFMGNGTIENANNKVSGVTYETKPEKVTGIGADAYDDDDSGEDEDATTFKPSSVIPANAETDVAVSKTITVTFPNVIYDDDGDTPSSSYLSSCFELRKGGVSGSRVSFTAKMSGTRKVIIDPDNNLADDTKYYVILKSGVFEDANGNTNSRATYYFTTEEGPKYSVTFSPENGDTEVDTDSKLKVNFSSTVYKDGGDKVTETYLSNTAIELRERSTSGTEVKINVTADSSSRVLTVVPATTLKPGTSYYLIVNANTLEYADKTDVTKQYAYFTTGNDLTMTVTPAYAQTNVSADTEIVIEFNSEIYRSNGSNVTTSYLAEEAIELRKSSSGGTEVDFTVKISSDRKTVTIIPSELVPGTRYYVNVLAGKIANKSGSENEKVSTYFTVANQMTPVITPANGNENVVPSTDIVIKFNEALYDRSGNPITSEYVQNSVVTLRKNSSSGTKINFEALINKDYNEITIVPTPAISPNSTYYLYVSSGTLYNKDRRSNSSATSLFKTTYSGIPDILPYNGEKDVERNANIEIVFDKKMYAIGGSDLTTNYIKNNVVSVYKDDEDGTKIAFTPYLSTDKMTLTINPTYDFDGETKYLVVINEATMEDEEGNENVKAVSSFTTKEKISTIYTISPANNAKDVPLNTSVVLEFESAVYRSGSTIASGAYITNNVVELRKSSANGEKITCKAVISQDNKTITVTPEKPLDPSTTYYVKVNAGSLKYSDETGISSKTSYFKTHDGKPVVSAFEVKENGVGASYATFLVTASADSTAYITLVDSKGTKLEADGVEVEAFEETEVEVKGLASNTTYTASVYVKDANGVTSVAKTASVKTLDPVEFSVEAGETAAAVKVEVFCAGTIKIDYKNKTTGQTKTAMAGLKLKADTEREFKLTGLDHSSEYIVYIEFEDEAGAVIKLNKTFKTTEPKEEVLEITSVTLKAANGDEYDVTLKDGKGEVTVYGETEYVILVSESSVVNSVFTYNGGSEFKPGEDSQKITVTAGEASEIKITLKSNDTEKETEAIVSVTINQ